MLEHPGWSGVLAVEEDIVIATNKPVGERQKRGGEEALAIEDGT